MPNRTTNLGNQASLESVRTHAHWAPVRIFLVTLFLKLGRPFVILPTLFHDANHFIGIDQGVVAWPASSGL
jgi:hypothetical protein